MLKQRTINPKMRGILVDWLVPIFIKLVHPNCYQAEVCVKFKLLSETLFLAVNIVDKYLSAREISRYNSTAPKWVLYLHRSQFQLLGVTALLIATKFEEIYSVEINDLVYISDNACTAAQIKLVNFIIYYLLLIFIVWAQHTWCYQLQVVHSKSTVLFAKIL